MKIIAIIFSTLIMFSGINASAVAKIKMRVDSKAIYIQTGMTEYITDLEGTLKSVRVWISDDHLDYDINVKGVKYNDDEKRKEKKMSEKQADAKWIYFQKEYLKLKERLELRIIQAPKKLNKN